MKIPSKLELLEKIKSTQFAESNGQLDPDLDLFVKSLNESFADSLFDCYSKSIEGIDQLFISSATLKYYLDKLSIERTGGAIKQKDATKSSGNILVVSSSIIEIPVNTSFLSGDYVYNSKVTRTTASQTVIVSAIRDSNIITCTAVNHNLATGMTIYANIGSVTGNFEIQVLSKDTFSFKSTGNNFTSTNGQISFIGVLVPVESEEASKDVNKTFTSLIELATNINDVIFVGITYDGITGGSDLETLQSYQQRLFEYATTPQNKGNLFQHRSWILQNTTANFCYFNFREDALYFYLDGIVSKYDEKFNLIDFSNDELIDIKANFLAKNQMIIALNPSRVTIKNADKIQINITITGMLPATSLMKDAVTLRLREYFARLPIKKYIDVFSDISQTKISYIINSTRDSLGNNPAFSSIAISNTGALVNDDHKAILGTLTFN